MNYYTETNYFDHDELLNAYGKGRDDYFEMFRRCGLVRIPIRVFKDRQQVGLISRIRLEAGLRREWKKALSKAGRGDTLFIHTPPSEKFSGFESSIRLARSRGCRIAVVVFDLEEFMSPFTMANGRLKYYMSRRLEQRILSLADAVMVHNDAMKEYIAGMGVPRVMIVPVGVMDYLRDEEPDEDEIMSRRGRSLPLQFCGSLAAEKAGFVREIPADLSVDIYGSGLSCQPGGNVSYRGAYDSTELMDILAGSFGLVWDGASADTVSGAFGEYMRYSSPHKMALYLASGLPVIVWKESAMAGFVEREKCGITVGSLHDVRGLIDAISDEEYCEMTKNAIRIAADLRKGSHIRNAVEKTIEILSCRSGEHGR
ncbi:MAG: hypothetical protein IJH95_06545 [Mogibacterium sp.]|nr:hypothetical protein [Mogibacterium sp.]